MNLTKARQYLREIQLDTSGIDDFDRYPFCLRAVKNLTQLDLHPKVTFLVGENGSGKSTILEAVATSFGFNPESGSKNFVFSTMETHSELHRHIKLVKGLKRAEDGFFLRAESFYNLASKIEELDAAGGSGPPIIASYGGLSLHQQSHGESFWALFMNRLRGNGLYLLDEPEAALSPSRQMSLLSRMHQLVQQDAQFIIATHSPILMAYPEAIIYSLDHEYAPIDYRDTDHYQITREFLNNTDAMLRILMED